MTGLTHRQTEILNIARAYGRVMMVDDLARRFEVSARPSARTSTIFAPLADPDPRRPSRSTKFIDLC